MYLLLSRQLMIISEILTLTLRLPPLMILFQSQSKNRLNVSLKRLLIGAVDHINWSHYLQYPRIGTRQLTDRYHRELNIDSHGRILLPVQVTSNTQHGDCSGGGGGSVWSQSQCVCFGPAQNDCIGSASFAGVPKIQKQMWYNHTCVPSIVIEY